MLSIISFFNVKGQVSGNANYQNNQYSNPSHYGSNQLAVFNPNLSFEPQGELTFTMNGLYNCKADSYLAIFSITQVGKTQKEVNRIISNKIDTIRFKLIQEKKKVDLFVDMISFVPVYEYVMEKKLFSKKTYNEIPKGFELKKNLHFKFSDPEVVNLLVEMCAEQEIYDLVRVDYFVEDMETKKNELINKVKLALGTKMNRYKLLLDEDFSDKQRFLNDAFFIHYPVEQYNSYQAYCSNSINVKPGANVNTVNKTNSSFYMPKQNKNYDVVVNAVILEPVVQIEYQLKLKLTPKPEIKKEPKEIIKVETKVQKDIFLVTPDAKVQKLNL